MIQATFDHIDDLTDSIKMLWFKPTSKVDQIAGQFIELKLPHDKVDDRGDKRWFTLCSSPTEDMVAITTRLLDDGGSSFKRTLASLKPGDKATFSDPMGDFVLPKNKNQKLLFVAGGIGITPMRSMIKWLEDSGESRDIQLIYAAREKEDLIFYDLFENNCTRLDPVLSSPPEDWQGDSGRLDAETIASMCSDLSDRIIYLSGPEPMLEKLHDDLVGSGVSSNRIITDYFPGYATL